MLVLSRRENEKVVFANLGVSVEVLRLAGKVVRLGIDAPAEIQILREELTDPAAAGDPSAKGTAPAALLTKTLRHTIRNRLNIASLGLQVLQRRLESGDEDAAEATIAKIFNELSEIDAVLDSSKQAELARQHESSQTPAHPPPRADRGRQSQRVGTVGGLPADERLCGGSRFGRF